MAPYSVLSGNTGHTGRTVETLSDKPQTFSFIDSKEHTNFMHSVRRMVKVQQTHETVTLHRWGLAPIFLSTYQLLMVNCSLA